MRWRLPGAPVLRILMLGAPLLGALPLGGCAEPGCGPSVSATLMFGLSTPAGPVSPAAFEAFLDRSVTPRFPEGLTMLEGSGRWRAQDGRMTAEASRLVMIVTQPGPATMARLEAIRAEYKAAFWQESVGLLMQPGCADF